MTYAAPFQLRALSVTFKPKALKTILVSMDLNLKASFLTKCLVTENLVSIVYDVRELFGSVDGSLFLKGGSL